MMWMTPNTSTFHNTIVNTDTANINDSSQQQYNPLHAHAHHPSSSSQTPATPTFYTNKIDASQNLDIDSETRSQTSSLSSSPNSVGSFPLSTFDSLPLARVPRTSQDDLYRFPAPTSNMMYTDTWGASGDTPAAATTFTPKTNGRHAHNRESSLSSLGSLGPASPFSFNGSNPHIALNDSNDNYQGLQLYDDQSYQLAAKAPNMTPHDNLYTNYPPSSDNTSLQVYAAMLAPQKHRGDRSAGGLLPPPDLGGSSHSRPGSVASSVASDSPATPAAPEPQEDRRRKTTNGENFFLAELLDHLDDRDPDSSFLHHAGLSAVPKLDRTMTDIFGDELYNPNFNITSASPSQPSQAAMSPTHDVFVQRLQAANQHLNATTQSPISTISRGRSPFRQGSPLAPAPSHEFPQASSNFRFNTAQQQREQRKAQEDTTQALRAMAQSTSTGTPQTISPKDALLEFTDSDSNGNFPLFPEQQATGFDANQLSKATTQANNDFGALSLDTSFDNYLTSQLSHGMPMPQQYPFVAKPRPQPSLPSATSGNFSISSRVGSSPSVSSESVASGSPRRPDHVGAEGGTYTCTYHGCSQRFESPALLQKHKREGHRQAHGLNTLRRPEGPAASYFNTQAGPHKCERINPSTGKPCNTVFSRPYDLTRHEDTIHNGRKQKVRCDVCKEEKTFSRADALTRHYRVCHPDLEFPGKQRKRGGVVN